MNNLADLLSVTGVCPILVSAEADMVVPLAKALTAGGVPAVEVLLRDENSLANMSVIAKEVPEVIVGAGTVISAEQAERAVDQGAKFVVIPGFSRPVVEYCLKKNVPVIPGCVTSTEIISALEYGLTIIKFFPVYEMGGVPMLQHLSGPFPMIRYMVAGGLSSQSFLPLMKHPKVLAAGGDWMFTDGDAQKNRDYELIAKNLRHSVYQVQDLHNAMALQK